MSTYEWVVAYKKLREIYPEIYTLEYFENLKNDLLDNGDTWREGNQFQNYLNNLTGVYGIIAYLKGELVSGC